MAKLLMTNINARQRHLLENKSSQLLELASSQKRSLSKVAEHVFNSLEDFILLLTQMKWYTPFK